MKFSPILLAVALSTVAASAAAQRPGDYDDRRHGTWRHDTRTPEIDRRQANQEARIQRGVHSGRLTPREAMYLEREQRRIWRTERAFKSDGRVTADERAQLMAMLDRADWHIRRELRD